MRIGIGTLRRFTYDGLNNLTAFTDAKGGRVEFLYDDELRLETVVNAAGRKWVFSLTALAYNIKRTISLVSVAALIAAVRP